MHVHAKMLFLACACRVHVTIECNNAFLCVTESAMKCSFLYLHVTFPCMVHATECMMLSSVWSQGVMRVTLLL